MPHPQHLRWSVEQAEQLMRMTDDPTYPTSAGEDLPTADRQALLDRGSRKPPTTATACGFADDEIREIGDRIADLTLVQAAQLSEYLKTLKEKSDGPK